jgi:predicted transcriptional regulator
MTDEEQEIAKIINKNYKEYTKFHYPLSYQILYLWKNYLGKDLETNLILSNLTIKALRIYNQNNKKKSYKEFIKTKQISIGKVKKAELSRELLIPRETIRRKLEDLKKENFIDMVDGNIDINRKSFEIKYLDTIINKYSKCLNIILDNLGDDKTITKKSITEDYLLNNFSKCWINLMSMMIELSLIWRKFLKSMENWFIFGTCGLNQMYNLKDSKNFRDLHPDNTENFFLNLTQEETSRGLNPTTISDLTGIPRQTVIRNLKNLTKSKALEKDTRRNLFYVPKNTSQQKSIVETLKKIQLVISQNVNKTLIAV